MTTIEQHIETNLAKELAEALINEGRIQGTVQEVTESIITRSYWSYKRWFDRPQTGYRAPLRYKDIVTTETVNSQVGELIENRKRNDCSVDYSHWSDFLLMELHLLRLKKFETSAGFKGYLRERIIVAVMNYFSFPDRDVFEKVVTRILNGGAKVRCKEYSVIKALMDRVSNETLAEADKREDDRLYWMLKLWYRHKRKGGNNNGSKLARSLGENYTGIQSTTTAKEIKSGYDHAEVIRC